MSGQSHRLSLSEQTERCDSMEPEGDETTFLCGYQRTRRYGSTGGPVSYTPLQKKRLVRHVVLETDTLPGLALRYNCSMTEIKRVNRLWCNASLQLKDWVNIPVGCDDACTPSSDTPPASMPMPMHESMHELFNRVDRVITVSQDNVQRLQRQSTIDQGLVVNLPVMKTTADASSSSGAVHKPQSNAVKKCVNE